MKTHISFLLDKQPGRGALGHVVGVSYLIRGCLAVSSKGAAQVCIPTSRMGVPGVLNSHQHFAFLILVFNPF